MTYYVVEYRGPFGFIKPWTAVRDLTTFSQQFLTPSIIEGIRQLLGVEHILRHRLSYSGLSEQQERIQGPGYVSKSIKGRKGWKVLYRNQSIVKRSVLIDPVLHLAFASAQEAAIAVTHHICLCRNEDILFPVAMQSMSEAAFDALTGFELLFDQDHPDSFLVGYNRYRNAQPMYGVLRVVGNASFRQEL
jgi:hypothetical protein